MSHNQRQIITSSCRWVRAIPLYVPIQRIGTYNRIAVTRRCDVIPLQRAMRFQILLL